MGETDYLHLSKTSGSDGDTMSFYNWRLLQDGDVSSNTLKIDNWASETGSALDILEQLSLLVAPADAEYLVAGSSTDLTNERVLASGCGIAISQDSTTLTIKANLIAGTGITISENTSASTLTLNSINTVFGISFSIGDGINPIIENTYKVARVPYQLSFTSYNLFMDKIPASSVTMLWQTWNGTAWTTRQTIATSTQITSGSYSENEYPLASNTIMRAIFTEPSDVLSATLSLTIEKAF